MSFICLSCQIKNIGCISYNNFKTKIRILNHCFHFYIHQTLTPLCRTNPNLPPLSANTLRRRVRIGVRKLWGSSTAEPQHGFSLALSYWWFSGFACPHVLGSVLPLLALTASPFLARLLRRGCQLYARRLAALLARCGMAWRIINIP